MLTIFRYTNNVFNSNRKATFSIDATNKEIVYNNKKYLIKIWDTAGQEKYAVLTKNYYKKAQGIIVACSLEDKASFNNLNKWLKCISDNTIDNIQIIIIGNKSDLCETRQVREWELEEIADKLYIKSFETSAKTNQNIAESFNYIINQILNTFVSDNKVFKGFNLYNKSKNVINNKQNVCCKR